MTGVQRPRRLSADVASRLRFDFPPRTAWQPAVPAGQRAFSECPLAGENLVQPLDYAGLAAALS
ncbi:MAG TPA: hypothetical protein VM510_01350, partial [Caulifigura sp.]|nr:hypothetical protein [Caulifigura sp.]